MEDLKCHYCGADCLVVGESDVWNTECVKCMASGPTSNTAEEAVDVHGRLRLNILRSRNVGMLIEALRSAVEENGDVGLRSVRLIPVYDPDRRPARDLAPACVELSVGVVGELLRRERP